MEMIIITLVNPILFLNIFFNHNKNKKVIF